MTMIATAGAPTGPSRTLRACQGRRRRPSRTRTPGWSPSGTGATTGRTSNGLAPEEYSSRYAQAKRIAGLGVRGRPVPDEDRPSKQQLVDVAWWMRRGETPPLEAMQDQLEAERWLEAMQDKRAAIELGAE